MIRPRTRTAQAGIGAVALAATLGLAACGTDNNSVGNASAAGTDASGARTAGGVACAKGSIQASGSSAQANAMAAWIAAYQGACPGSTINYQATGSGAGVTTFTQGTTGFAGSDSALKDSEHPAADARCKSGKAIDLPMVPGPISVMYNLQGVDDLVLDAPTIAKIFSGAITRWDDPAIKALNSGASLPSTGITTFHRSDESGTTDNFSKYLAAAAPSVWTFEGGKKWSAPGGQGAAKSAGVTQAVKAAPGSVTYTEYSYAKNAGLPSARIATGAASPVELTPANVGNAVAAAQVVGTGDDLALKLDYATKADGAYPILLVTYEITCQQGLAPADLALVKSFLGYTASDDGQKVLEDQGYAPLPKQIQSRVQSAIGSLS